MLLDLRAEARCVAGMDTTPADADALMRVLYVLADSAVVFGWVMAWRWFRRQPAPAPEQEDNHW